MNACSIFPTQLGWMGIELRRAGVWRVVFDQPSESAAWRALGGAAKRVDRADELQADEPQDHEPQDHDDIVARLTQYALGEVEALDEIEVDLSGRTPFQLRVLRACRRIPAGQTRTYAELAAQAGSPAAARAVGSVMARNQVPLIIPCHRVVGSDRSLGGFSSPSGLQMKRRLLQLEAQYSTLAIGSLSSP